MILGVLLAGGTDGCSTDALVDALWGDEPPAAAMTVLHAQISRLRRILEPHRPARAPASVLRSTESGYLLDIAGHRLDAERFTRLVDDGRDAMRDGDPAVAKQHVLEALSLWRGRAYGELADHFAIVAAATALEEQRLAAEDLLVEARLQLGEHAEVVGELTARVRAHPYREATWAHLVLALYRSGRQADALAAYQDCRRRFVDELGIEPRPELQALNEAVLLQSPELEWREAAEGAPAAAARPAQSTPLPRPRTSFVGREQELKELESTLEEPGLVTVIGPGGVGKTRLAVEVAGRTGPHFRHGVAFCDLVGVPDGGLVPGAIADAVGLEALGAATDDPLVGHLRGRELLLVIDNADHTIDAVATVADELLSGCPRLTLLVTCREALRLDGERLHVLAPLAASGQGDPAVRLFEDRSALSAAAAQPDRDQVLALCQRLDGLPLAIELAASRLRAIPLDRLVDGLDDHLSALAGVNTPRGSTPHRTLRDVIDWSVDLLTDDQRALLRRLAVFSGGCTLEAAAAVCEIDSHPVEALAGLVERSMVELQARGDAPRYRLLETIRADGLTRLAEHGEVERFRGRHLAWCLSLLPSDPGHGEDPADVEHLTPEIDNIVAALAWSLEGHDPASGARLAVAAAPYWIHSGRFGEARRWLERAVDATALDSAEHRLVLRWLGWTLARQGDFGEARGRLETALDLAATAGDIHAHRDAAVLLGAVEIDAGELEAGAARLERQEPDADEDWGRRHRAVRCHALGVRAVQEGRPAEAIDLLQQAAHEAREARMWHTLVRVLTSLSQSESGRRRVARADGALAEALTIARRHRLLGLMPRILGVRALQTARRGETADARSLFEEALAAARSVGDRRVELITLNNLGILDLTDGQPGSAVERLEQAVDLTRLTKDERNELLLEGVLAEAVVAASHDTQRALGLATDVIERSRRIGIRTATITAVESAAIALIDRVGPGDLERAGLCLGASAAEREALDWPEETVGSQLDQARQRIEEILGSEVAEKATRRGRELGLDAIAEELLTGAGSPSRGPAPSRPT